MSKKIIPTNLIEQREFKSSSSNNIYIAKLYENCVSCDCPAGGRKTLCKHIKSILFDNLEKIQDEMFKKNILKALEVSNSDVSNEYKRQVYSKIYYVDEDIAKKAHINSIYFDINIEKINEASKIRVENFKTTITNLKHKLKLGLDEGYINIDEYNQGCNILKTSINSISKIDFEDL